MVVSPGAGVFDSTEDKIKVTKERVLDDGVGCDLVGRV
jgi:hypothetical protein